MSRKRHRSPRRETGEQARAPEQPAEARAGRGRGRVVRGHRPHALDNWLLGLASTGIVLTAYLLFNAWFGERPAFCGAGSGCDLVQHSRWAKLLGLPIAFWGLLTYALLARLAWRLRARPSTWQAALTVAAVAAGVSWYLTAVSVFVIEATCAYCLASFAIANALLVLLLVRRPAHMPEHAWARSLPTPAAAAATAVLALFLHFSGLFDPAAGPEKPRLKALALHLRDSGARFYGAYWCPACNEQKTLFEASADRLPYVECTPDGRRGALNVACVVQAIKDYPTWMIGGRRHTGVITVEELARLSHFRWPDEAAGKQ